MEVDAGDTGFVEVHMKGVREGNAAKLEMAAGPL